ncbi:MULTISPECIES: RpiB/LacA/LacB family sugar-phosphate isomerase [Chromohalobacter]|uniref:RpiB/LacA/LacB family sugar-phosphate isomerase n=1 Tax=Chromohalobacter TaxID=42054 RepID=UPI000D70D79E|nr:MULTISPECIES: RpiB/LacA/LacB family sugar-phosphate isomerase [Chromohalobacter]MBZ5876202.1 RpiB/LacA/LacB family sugar-phosphate isomerase [Chromohalobacter salexigens]MDO0945160.1 RpiB/LacA/LacB family sugar-phosphate isomerase [Chromohalobacter salexigens]NQY47296.1 RpiB/LacA/LacB family sugar-phosphate isomerase [Chromohalobacter sp.]NWO55655.1 ribose-5-phosphate isomerase [Chromohalobacter salexigens]PWW42686.1 ribose-5-phosphate isomerase [Chromohalobacter salexigens]
MSDSRTAGHTAPVRVALGGDEAAYELKALLIEHVRALGHEAVDFGTYDAEPVLYPDVAVKVARAIEAGEVERGVLVCGTGIGVAISANKVRGIRAAQAHDTYSAAKARSSNDAQIVTLGARVVGPELAKTIVTTFLATEFAGGGSREKVARILAYERETFRDPPRV